MRNALRLFALVPLAVLSAQGAAAQPDPCRGIADNKARLACYDRATKAKADPMASPEFTAARIAIGLRLRDPASVNFEKLELRTVTTNRGELRVVCGIVTARNPYGGDMSPRRFVFFTDAKFVLFDDGTESSRYLTDLAVPQACEGPDSVLVQGPSQSRKSR